jgi:COP9 signalosome complex subunit 1
MSHRGAQLNTGTVSGYVSANPDEVKEFVESFPQDQQVARYMHIWRLVGRERDTSTAASARAALAPRITACIKQGRDTRLYRAFTQQCFEAGYDGVSLDAEWAAAKDRQNSADLEKLQVALGQAQGSLAKDGIRVALSGIADHYFQTGDTQAALKHAARSRETCSTPEHNAQYCIQAFRICAFSESGQNLASAAPYVQRLEQIADTLDVQDFARCRITAGLLSLERRSYRAAANTLTNLRNTGSNTKTTATLDFAPIVEPFMRTRDFALFVTILVLSQFERTQLDAFLSNPDFKVLFETEADLRAAIASFHECKYFDALSTLATLHTQMKLDPFLSGHAGQLLNAVRAKAIRQYVSPFVSVDLKKMADVFRTTVDDLERELAQMISRKEIEARIDKTRGALQATHSDPKQQAALRSAELAADFVQDSEMAIRTLSMLRNNVMVQAPALVVHKSGGAMPAGAPAGAGAAGSLMGMMRF